MITQKTLSNGIRLITRKFEHVHSVTLGIWIGTGSVKEEPGEEGISHFIEHMLFKGTPSRTAKQIAAEMDSIGAQLNAFTSKECTCYYAKVMDEHLPKAVDVLCDIVLNSSYDAAEMEKEKAVVAEEIMMVEDSPEDLVHDVLSQTFFGGHRLASPVLGTKQSVMAFTRDDLLNYLQKHYANDNIVIAAAGNFEQDLLEGMLLERFTETAKTKLEYPGGFEPSENRFVSREKDIEQVHICMAMPGYPIDDERLYTLFIVNNIFGGSMSSRLFQHIREEKGLAYSVYSYPSAYMKTGMFALYAGTGAEQAETVVQLMLEELAAMREKGVSEEEFIRAREQMKGNYILGLESMSAHMNTMGKSQLLLGKVYTEEETLRRINAVTMERVAAVIDEIFDESRLTGAFVGRMGKREENIRKLLGS